MVYIPKNCFSTIMSKFLVNSYLEAYKQKSIRQLFVRFVNRNHWYTDILQNVSHVAEPLVN